MRSLLSALTASVAVVFVSLVVGCGSAADPVVGGDPADIYGAEIPAEGDLGDDGAIGDDGDDGVLSDEALVAVDESVPGSAVPFAGTKTATTTGNLNLRKGPGASYAILAVMPAGSVVTVLDPTPKNAYLQVVFNGTTGWAHSAYLESGGTTSGGTSGPVDIDGPASPDNTIARAKAAVGFSYWWGGGAWLASGATASNRGSCSGSCPSCSHSGKYGADCSGLVAKAWQFGIKALEVNSLPYGTIHFNKDVAGKWSTVSRGSLQKGDALVYNTNGAGHIVIYEKGDGWGAPTVYECRGCSYGCVYNTRSFTSNYHGIRRAGF